MRRAAVLPFVLLAALVPACNSGTEGSGGADASGPLTVYSGRSESLVKPLIEMFEKDTGIDVEVRYAGSGELAAQLLEEGANSPADVFFSQDAGALGAVAKANLLGGLADSSLDRVDERFRADDGRWVGVSGRARVIAFNATKLAKADVPTSVFDLVEPRWKGKIGFAPTNASFQSFVTAMRVISGEAETKTWLEGFKANQPKSYEGNSQVLDAVDSGQVELGLVNHYYRFEKAAEVGEAKVSAQNAFLAAGDPGALVNVAGVGIVKGSERPDAAERFVDYLLGTQAQTYFRDETFEYPLAAGVTQAPGLPPLAEVSGPQIDLSDLDSLEQTLALLDEVGLT